MSDTKQAEKKPLKPVAVILRNPIPNGPVDAREGIERRDGGWKFTDAGAETAGEYWVPDSNVIAVRLG